MKLIFHDQLYDWIEMLLIDSNNLLLKNYSGSIPESITTIKAQNVKTTIT